MKRNQGFIARQLMTVAAMIAPMFGRFGDHGKREDMPGMQIAGYGSPGKSAGRHKRKAPKPRTYGIVEEYYSHTAIRSSMMYDALRRSGSRHGRCTDWIRENRRRRAAGLPQLRAA